MPTHSEHIPREIKRRGASGCGCDPRRHLLRAGQPARRRNQCASWITIMIIWIGGATLRQVSRRTGARTAAMKRRIRTIRGLDTRRNPGGTAGRADWLRSGSGFILPVLCA